MSHCRGVVAVALGRRFLCAGGMASAVCGCAGAIHRLPGIGEGQVQLAQTEIESRPAASRLDLSDEDTMTALGYTIERIGPAAQQVCGEIGKGVCTWRVRPVRSSEMNAFATGDGLVVINKGIVEMVRSPDELAFVQAHEIAHHAANHVRQSVQNQRTGALVGALVLGTLMAAAAGALSRTTNTYQTRQASAEAVRAGGRIGAAVGRVSFSKEQEREADYIGAVIVYRSGFDLAKARNFLVTLAQASRRERSGMFDTHPAGPERLAAFDRAAEEIVASNGALPAKA